MQIPVFAPSGADEDVMGVLSSCVDPLALECVPYWDWVEFGRAANRALASVVVTAKVDAAVTRRLATLRELVSTGLVWVQGSRDGGRRRTVPLAGVVSLDAPSVIRDHSAFPVAYHRARAHGFLRDRALGVATRSDLTAQHIRFVETALLTDPPLRTSTTFAETCGVETAHLQYRFRVYTPGTSPKELLQWALMVHVALRRPPGHSWEWLARELGGGVHRLRRTARRLLELTLTEAEADHGAMVRASFDDYLTQAFGLDAAQDQPATGTSNAM